MKEKNRKILRKIARKGLSLSLCAALCMTGLAGTGPGIVQAAGEEGIQVETARITVSEDTFIGSWSDNKGGGDQNANYGTTNFLRVAYGTDSTGLLGLGSGGDNKVTFLKFNLADVKDKKFDTVKLNLTLLGVRYETAAGKEINIKAGTANDEWKENELKWNIKPSLVETESSALAESEAFTPGNTVNNNPENITTPDGTNVTTDVTEFVQSAINANNDSLTLVVNASEDNSIPKYDNSDANRFYFVSKEGAAKYTGAQNMAPALVFTKTPEDGELLSIEVTAPTKKKYQLGEKLDTAGMKITTICYDSNSKGETKKVIDNNTDGITITGFDSSTPGKKTVTVTYQGKTASFTVAVVETYDSFKPNIEWLDTDGNMIQAHGGGIIWDENSQKYYWYGENKSEKGTTGVVSAIGVSCYSSEDLYNWKFESIALPVFNNPAFLKEGGYTNDTPLYLSESSKEYQAMKAEGLKVSAYNTLDKYNTAEQIAALNQLYKDSTAEQKKAFYDILSWDCIMERPKVIYNDKTKKYVMWFHEDGPGAGHYNNAHAGVAISDSPAGPFKLVKSERPNGNMSRDMTLFKDDDGKAYLLHSSENNQVLHISELDEDYTGVTGRYSRNYTYGTGEPWAREAPALFKYQGYYYLISSGCTGWDPNQMGYSVTENLTEGMTEKGGDGPFQFINNQRLTNPCTGEGANKTFGGQSTYVLPVQGKEGCFIYMGDLWKPADLTDSRYQWLPIQIKSDEQTITIPWMESWNIEELDRMNKWKILDDAITDAETMYCEEEYTLQSWAAVADAVESGKLLRKTEASNTEVRQAAENITTALGALVKREVTTETYDLSGKEIKADSEQASANNQADKAIDGNPATYWHSSWDNGAPALPHYVTINLGEQVENLYELTYTPRQDKDDNGIVTEYEILVSNANKALDNLTEADFKKVRHGKWPDDKDYKSAVFLPGGAVKFVRFKVLAGVGGHASAAEIGLKVASPSTVNKNNLKEKIDYLTNLHLDETHYTTPSWQKLQDALDIAGKVMESGTVTQKEVDDATNTLEDALKNLEETSIGTEPTPTPTGNAGTPAPTPTPTGSTGTPAPTPTPTGSTGTPAPTPTPTPTGNTGTPAPTPTGNAGTPAPTGTSSPMPTWSGPGGSSGGGSYIPGQVTPNQPGTSTAPSVPSANPNPGTSQVPSASTIPSTAPGTSQEPVPSTQPVPSQEPVPGTDIKVDEETGAVTETTTITDGNKTIVTEKETIPDGSESVKETVTENTGDLVNVTETLTDSNTNSVLVTEVASDNDGNVIDASAVIYTGVSDTGNQYSVKPVIPKSYFENVKDAGLDSVDIYVEKPTVDNAKEKIGPNMLIKIALPDVGGVSVRKVIVTKDSIESAKGNSKKLVVKIQNEDPSKSYTVTIPQDQLKKMNQEINVSVKTGKVSGMGSSNSNKVNKILSSNKVGEDNSYTVAIASNNTKGGIKVTTPAMLPSAKKGDKVYAYAYNKKTGKLEEIPNSQRSVIKNGEVAIEGFSGSTYVITDKELSGKKVVKLLDQTKVSVSKTSVKKGGKTKIKLDLGTGLVAKPSVKSSTPYAKQAAVVTYKSSDPKKVKVSKDGTITAKGKGKAKITVKIKLAGGKVKTVKKY